MNDEELMILLVLLLQILNVSFTTLCAEEDEIEDADDDMEIVVIARALRCRKMNKPYRIQNYIENVVWNYVGRQFQQNFRMSVEAYEGLLGLIGPTLMKQGDIGRNTISVEKQLLSVIWLLATPDSYRSVGERFDLAKSSLAKCFVRVVKALNTIAPDIIKWPRDNRLDIVKEGFQHMSGIENVIGAVDGTFIVIKAPKEDTVSYITRKCNYAMTLQAIADHELRFIDSYVGFPGSVSDTRIFKNSDIYFAVQNDHASYFPNGEFIIGDKAYPILTWCIPSYINRGNLTEPQRFFNTKLAQSRQTIERAFALLFGRFRRLKFLDMNKTSLIPSTVLACCVLHNICLNFEDDFIDEYVRGGLLAVMENDEMELLYLEHQRAGRNKRDQICRTLFQNNH